MSDWITINLPFSSDYTLSDERDEHGRSNLVKGDSFEARGLANPGTLVMVKGVEYMLGHVNTSGGSCDCCPGLGKDDIVTHYKVVWAGDQ